MPSDLKEGLSSARKADITHVRRVLMNFVARACEYGNVRYERANYMRPVTDKYTGTPHAKDFERLRSYLRALQSHVTAALDALELHQSGDYHLTDVEGMRRAAYAEDTDEPPPDSKVGASHLPHLAHAGASLMMALVQASLSGLLPDDPGVRWKMRATTEKDLAGLQGKKLVPLGAPFDDPKGVKDNPNDPTRCHSWMIGVRCKLSDGHYSKHDYGERCALRAGDGSNSQCHNPAGHAGPCYHGLPL